LWQNLRKNLLEELEQNFPDEVETFRESRAASAAVSVTYPVFYFKVGQNDLPTS
jgi:hypothetical protein